MKKLFFKAIFCLTLIAGNTLVLKGQKYNGVFEDGSKIPYDIVVNDPDKIHKFWIGLGPAEKYVFNYLDARYFHSPKLQFRFLVGAFPGGNNTGSFSGSAYGSYFLATKVTDPKKESRIRLLKSSGTQKKYFVKHPLKVKKSIGPELGIEYLSLPEQALPKMVFGLHANSLKFIRLAVIENNIPRFVQGTRSLSLHADFLYYPVKNINYPDMGGRVYLEGYFSFWGSKAWGLCYYLGFNIDKNAEGSALDFSSIRGIGLYGAFGKR